MSSYIILLFYIDDMLVANLNMDEIRNVKMHLSKEFDMNNLGSKK